MAKIRLVGRNGRQTFPTWYRDKCQPGMTPEYMVINRSIAQHTRQGVSFPATLRDRALYNQAGVQKWVAVEHKEPDDQLGVGTTAWLADAASESWFEGRFWTQEAPTTHPRQNCKLRVGWVQGRRAMNGLGM
jgi:hypothetical protein